MAAAAQQARGGPGHSVLGRGEGWRPEPLVNRSPRLPFTVSDATPYLALAACFRLPSFLTPPGSVEAPFTSHGVDLHSFSALCGPAWWPRRACLTRSMKRVLCGGFGHLLTLKGRDRQRRHTGQPRVFLVRGKLARDPPLAGDTELLISRPLSIFLFLNYQTWEISDGIIGIYYLQANTNKPVYVHQLDCIGTQWW